jgi:uncharacterized membrane protein YphA (DoxX/SURF4 family)
MNRWIKKIDKTIIQLAQKWYLPVARIAFFIIFFYFGALKLIGLSPATQLATAPTERTIGLQYFDVSFVILAIIECTIGILFLIPKATRVVIALLFIHLAVVCSPLVLVPEHVWSSWFVPNLEGQYIIKNIALVAIAIGIAAHVTPLDKKKQIR